MMRRHQLSCLLAGALLATPALAPAQTTTWTVASGDWGTPSNWSAGEPTAGVDAIINTTAIATVSMAGETCRSLLMGSGGGAQLEIVDGGSLTVDNATIGTNGGASLSTSGFGAPVLTVTHSLTISSFCDMVAGGGTINVGTTPTDSLIVSGTLQLTGNPAFTVTNLAMRDQSVLSVVVQFTGVTGVVSTGPAVLDGTLKVLDFSAPDGVYEIVNAGSIVGTFDAVMLPASGDWSWMIEGNKLLVMKGAVAVEAATWGGIKSGHYQE